MIARDFFSPFVSGVQERRAHGRRDGREAGIHDSAAAHVVLVLWEGAGRHGMAGIPLPMPFSPSERLGSPRLRHGMACIPLPMAGGHPRGHQGQHATGLPLPLPQGCMRLR